MGSSASRPTKQSFASRHYQAELGNELKLVRFADDFVVLCRQREEAEHVAALVNESLAEAGLEVKKTGVRSFTSRSQALLGSVCMGSSASRPAKQSFTSKHYQAELGNELMLLSNLASGGTGTL